MGLNGFSENTFLVYVVISRQEEMYIFVCVHIILCTSIFNYTHCGAFAYLNPFTTEARFYVLNAIAFSTQKRA